LHEREGKAGNGPMNKLLNFGGNQDTGIVFWIHHNWETQKVVNRHSFILICQIVAVVRRALAEVCTVEVVVVVECIYEPYVFNHSVAECNSCSPPPAWTVGSC